jgi:hypothetical protein
MCRSPGAPAAICTPALHIAAQDGCRQCRIDRTLCMRLCSAGLIEKLLSLTEAEIRGSRNCRPLRPRRGNRSQRLRQQVALTAVPSARGATQHTAAWLLCALLGCALSHPAR